MVRSAILWTNLYTNLWSHLQCQIQNGWAMYRLQHHRKGIHECHAVIRIHHKLCAINHNCPQILQIGCEFGCWISICNLAPHSQIVRFEPWWRMQAQGAQHASQPLSRGGLPQNKGHFRRNPSVPETKGASNPNYNRSPMMAENEKVLNSTKNATCGSTSPISKNCGSTKFQIEKLWIHIFKIMCFLKFVDPQFSDLEFCGSTIFWNRTCGSTKSK